GERHQRRRQEYRREISGAHREKHTAVRHRTTDPLGARPLPSAHDHPYPARHILAELTDEVSPERAEHTEARTKRPESRPPSKTDSRHPQTRSDEGAHQRHPISVGRGRPHFFPILNEDADDEGRAYQANEDSDGTCPPRSRGTTFVCRLSRSACAHGEGLDGVPRRCPSTE